MQNASLVPDLPHAKGRCAKANALHDLPSSIECGTVLERPPIEDILSDHVTALRKAMAVVKKSRQTVGILACIKEQYHVVLSAARLLDVSIKRSIQEKVTQLTAKGKVTG